MAQCTLAFCAGVKARGHTPRIHRKAGCGRAYLGFQSGRGGWVQLGCLYSQLASSRPVQSIGQLQVWQVVSKAQWMLLWFD